MTVYYLPFGPSIQLGQPYGSRPGLFPNPSGGHNGDDWLTPVGTPVRAAGDGVVHFAGQFDDTYADNFGWNLNYGGNMVVLNMDGDTAPYFEYAHLSEIYVNVGDRVKAGQIIALTGNSDGGTGVSTGAHCHVGCLPYNFNLGSSTYGRINPRTVMTAYFDSSIQVQGSTTQPLEDDELTAQYETDTRAEWDELRKFKAKMEKLDRDLRAQLNGLPALDRDLRADLEVKGNQIKVLTATNESLVKLLSDQKNLDLAAVEAVLKEALSGIKFSVAVDTGEPKE